MSHFKSTIVRYAPPRLAALLRSVYWRVHPNRRSYCIRPDGQTLRVSVPDGPSYNVPNAHHRARCLPENREHKLDTYTLKGFVEPESDDVVVDIGAFVGQFTLAVADRVDRVVAIEPTPTSFRCLKKNTEQHGNVTAHQYVVGPEVGTVTFNLGSDASDNSLLVPDDSEVVNEIVAESVRLETLLAELNIDHVGFLKLDAEGAEPEVLEACLDHDIEKVAVDASAERGGEPTAAEVRSILEEHGYTVRTDESPPVTVYGKQE